MRFNKNMIVIGISGKIGTGKTTVANYLYERYGFLFLTFKTLVEAECKKRGLPLSRENQQAIGSKIFDDMGPGGMADALLFMAESADRVVIEAFRHLAVVKAFKHKLGDRYSHIYLNANDEVRFERIKQRESEKDKGINSLDELRKVENNEIEKGILDIEEYSDIVVDTSDELLKVQSYIDGYLSKLI